MKRVLSAALALVLVVSLLPVWSVPASAAASPDLEALVGQQIKAYAASISKSNSHEDATLSLANHAITGRGAALHAGANHVVTACLHSSALMQVYLTDSCASLIQTMQQLGLNQIYGSGGVNWRSYGNAYSTHAYPNSQMVTADYLVAASSSAIRYGNTGYPGPLNANDETLLWTAGSTYVDIDMRRASATADTVTYDVTVLIKDRFDFDGNYSNANGNALFEKVVTLLGSVLGKLMFREFDWDSTVSFQLTVPNPCAHTSGSYHWTYDPASQVLTSDASGGHAEIGTTRYSFTSSTTGLVTYYHKLDRTVRLYHNKPWVLEYRIRQPGSFAFAPLETASSPSPYFLNLGMTSLYAAWRERVELTEAEKEAGGFTSVYQIYTHYYGTDLRDNFTSKYSGKQTYTVRLENVIAENGSNMVYVTIFNNDLQETVLEPTALNDYYLTVPGGTTRDPQNVESDWVSGENFLINYIGNKSYRLSAEYFDLTIWENGVDAAAGDYFSSKVTAPTCTKEGYTTKTCTLCSYSYRTDPVPATAHHYTPAVTAPTCTAQGFTTYTCSCGDSYVDDWVEAWGHSFGAYVSNGNAACTTDGTKTAKCGNCDATDTVSDAGSATGHRGGTAVCNAAASCTVCGEAYGGKNPANHTGGTEIRNARDPEEFQEGYTGDTHCLGCGEKLADGQTIPATHAHSFGQDWQSDAVNHWRACACGAKNSEAVHIPGPEATAAAAQTCTVCSRELAPALGYTTGDVNGDGRINAKDATMILQHIVGKLSGDKAFVSEAADINGDGRINAKDATLILQYIVGKADLSSGVVEKG